MNIIDLNVAKFAEKYRNSNSDDGCNDLCKNVRMGGVVDALNILKKEKRGMDLAEFHAIICGYLISTSPDEKNHNSDRLDQRFRDLLERAITPH